MGQEKSFDKVDSVILQGLENKASKKDNDASLAMDKPDKIDEQTKTFSKILQGLVEKTSHEDTDASSAMEEQFGEVATEKQSSHATESDQILEDKTPTMV